MLLVGDPGLATAADGAGIPDCRLGGAGMPEVRLSDGVGIPDWRLALMADSGRLNGVVRPSSSCALWTETRESGREITEIVRWCSERRGRRGVILAEFSSVMVMSPSSSRSSSDWRDLGRPKVRRREPEGVRGVGIERTRSE